MLDSFVQNDIWSMGKAQKQGAQSWQEDHRLYMKDVHSECELD